jgi:hypothetical protein
MRRHPAYQRTFNGNVIDAAYFRDLEQVMESEARPPLDELKSIDAKAGETLPGVAIKRYDEVLKFSRIGGA